MPIAPPQLLEDKKKVQPAPTGGNQFSISVDDIIGEANKVQPKGQFPTLSPMAPQGVPTIAPQATAAPAAAAPAAQPVQPPAGIGFGSPEFQQFAAPYQQYMGDIWSGMTGKMEGSLIDAMDALNRKMYGQNVGVESGIGMENVGKFLEDQTAQLAPYAQELAGQTGLQSISDYLNQLTQTGQSALGEQTLAAKQDARADEILAFDKQRFDETMGMQKDQFEKEYGLRYEEFLQSKNTALLDQVFEGTITGDTADKILSDLGFDPGDFGARDKRQELIENMVDAYIAKGKDVNWNQLNEWLRAKGQEPIGKEEIVSGTNGKNVLGKAKASKDKDLYKYLKSKGFSVDQKIDQMPGPGGGSRIRDEWIENNKDNQDKFIELYESDPEFKAYVDKFV